MKMYTYTYLYRIIILIQIVFVAIELGFVTYLIKHVQRDQRSGFEGHEGQLCETVKRPVVYVADDIQLLNNDKPTFIGYTMDILGLTRSGEGIDWDVHWSKEYPFRSKQPEHMNKHVYNFPDFLYHQKVNHIPGSGFFGNKEVFTTQGGKYIPKTFRIPEQKKLFLDEVNATTGKRRLWIQKNIWHRGNMVKEAHECDLTTRSLIQEYVANPFLVDGRKFSMSVFVVWTSFNPMRVYILENDTPFRFCSKDYYPEDFSDIAKYISDGIDTVNLTFYFQLPSLHMIDDVKYTNYQGLRAHIDSLGRDSSKLMQHMIDGIHDKVLTSIPRIRKMFPEKYTKLSNTFFELLRFDFVLDEDLHVHLLEANISPNFPDEAWHVNWTRVLFPNIIYNEFRVAGLVGLKRHNQERPKYIVRDSDTLIGEDPVCYTSLCNPCPSTSQMVLLCLLCHHCWSEDQNQSIKGAFLEHVNRGSMRRIHPTPPNKNLPSALIALENDRLTAMWFKAKCNKDIYWCS